MVNTPEYTTPREWTDQRRVWNNKYVLREVYEDLFQRVEKYCLPGAVLEVGSGISAFKERTPGVITLDVAFAPWLDIVADAQRLPVRAESLDGIAAIDVLHHLPEPIRFLSEAHRVLRPGGRLVLLEPAITPGSWFFYRFIHQERVDLNVDPFSGEPMCSPDPYDANQAIPVLLFERHSDRLAQELPGFRLDTLEYLSVLAYPLSGGFKSWSLLPWFLCKPVLALENRLPSTLKRWFGFRLLAVLSKQ